MSCKYLWVQGLPNSQPPDEHQRSPEAGDVTKSSPFGTADPSGDALKQAVREIEGHVSQAGWDGPVRVFALIRTAAALAHDPELGRHVHPDIVARASEDGEYLTAIEQEDLPAAGSVEELLARISFGPRVDGVAVSCERIVVPPTAEQDLPADPEDAVDVLMAHPQRRDVRLVVGVLRAGPNCCAIRQREHDSPAMVGVGPDIAPGVITALRATLDG
jgi:hypothetical protein